jgi:undecaprenyl-diphosphatase
MQEILQAIIYGIVQGLTEFLPVSSSGHLEIAKAIFGDDKVKEEGMLMTVVLHAATALSTLVIFRKDVAEILKGLFQFKNNVETRFALMIIISMIPAAFVGLFFEDQIDAFFTGNILLVGFMLLVTGLLLLLADKAKVTEKGVTPFNSLIIGISQAIAILPGISRSGATISTSVLLGIDRGKAARFSFLMVVPLILGAATLKLKDYVEVQALNDLDVETRTDEIMAELQKEEVITEAEFGIVRSIILLKEENWGKMDNGVLKDQYTKELNASLNPDAVDAILANDFSKVRATSINKLALIIGFLAAFVSGLFACKWMIALVKRSKLTYFSVYCFVIGIIAIGYTVFS